MKFSLRIILLKASKLKEKPSNRCKHTWYRRRNILRQECIPVGCVSPAIDRIPGYLPLREGVLPSWGGGGGGVCLNMYLGGGGGGLPKYVFRGRVCLNMYLVGLPKYVFSGSA